MTDDRRRMAEDRWQKTDDGRQMAEDRGQRMLNAEAGMRGVEISRISECGSRKKGEGEKMGRCEAGRREKR
ncbi:MAG: hypothetical protein KJP23_26070 [Deltaproteobacteria bacterium]|nr:hypothetical protein [Deltaproteobacteria bacterium]